MPNDDATPAAAPPDPAAIRADAERATGIVANNPNDCSLQLWREVRELVPLLAGHALSLLEEVERLKELPEWLVAKLKTLGEYYKSPTDGRDVVGEIQGWMHVLCFHYVQNRREVKEYDAARRKAKELVACNVELEVENDRLRARVAELEAAIDTALPYIPDHIPRTTLFAAKEGKP